MKLLIDVSEEDYKECVFRKDLLSLGGEPTDLTFNMRIETLIANGTPLSEELEKIRAKITACTSQGEGDFCDIHNNAIELARKVVDNRISELKGE